MACNVILLIMGMFLEGGAALMIITPLLLPVARQLGINDYHFGLVAIVNIMIGGITPPFGSMMFTTCGITGCPISEFPEGSMAIYRVPSGCSSASDLLPVLNYMCTGSSVRRSIETD
mgnify:CR=1 FL=1